MEFGPVCGEKEKRTRREREDKEKIKKENKQLSIYEEKKRISTPIKLCCIKHHTSKQSANRQKSRSEQSQPKNEPEVKKCRSAEVKKLLFDSQCKRMNSE